MIHFGENGDKYMREGVIKVGERHDQFKRDG